jgi:hypothetical protein
MTKPPALGKGGGLHWLPCHVVQHEDYFGIFLRGWQEENRQKLKKVLNGGDSAPLGVKPPRQGWRGETSKCGAKRILYGG